MTRRSRPRGDEFYVGYQPRMPPGTARYLGPRVAALLVVAPVLGGVIAWSHRPPAAARYEFGTVREFHGTVLDGPVPMLAVSDAGGAGETLLLAGQGKRGAEPLVAGLTGRPARLRGTVIRRGDQVMVEVHEAHAAAGDPAPAEIHDHGEVALRGEMVDSKCHLGAMNPGSGPTHRLCALRCLRGGLPPMLVARDAAGREVSTVVTGPAGAPLGAAVLRYVAARIAVTGRLRSVGTVHVLETDLASVTRVAP